MAELQDKLAILPQSSVESLSAVPDGWRLIVGLATEDEPDDMATITANADASRLKSFISFHFPDEF